MTKTLIVSIASLLISLMAFIALSCAPSADIGGERKGIAGSISYRDDIIGAVESPTSAIPSSNIIPSAATVEYSINPELPAGLSIVPNTGEIKGTPEAESPETDNTEYEVTASGIGNYMGKIVSKSFSITIRSALSNPMDISNSSIGYDNITGNVGKRLTISPSTNILPSTATVMYSISPELPAGLSIVSGTGKIEGIPEAEFPETETDNTEYVVTASAVDPYEGSTSSVPFTIFIAGEKSINGSVLNYSNISGMTEVFLSIIPTSTISTATDTAVMYTVNPSVLPDGLMLNPNTGVISGIPNQIFSSPGVLFQVTATATKTGGYTGEVESNQFTIEVKIPITMGSISYEDKAGPERREFLLSPSPSPSFVPDTATVEYSIDPELPAGLSIMSNTGEIVGIPETKSAETDNTDYVVTASGTGIYTGSVESNKFTIEITELAKTPITETSLSYADFDGVRGVAISSPSPLFPTLVLSPPEATVMYSITSGMLPAGLEFDSNSGVIEGRPTEEGEFNLEVTATANGDYEGIVESDEFTITIRIAIGGSYGYRSGLIEGAVGISMNIEILGNSLTPSEPGPEVRYEEHNNSLPAGLFVDPDTGAIKGDPRAATGEITGQTKAIGTGLYTGTVLSNEFRIKINEKIRITGAINYFFDDASRGTTKNVLSFNRGFVLSFAPTLTGNLIEAKAAGEIVYKIETIDADGNVIRAPQIGQSITGSASYSGVSFNTSNGIISRLRTILVRVTPPIPTYMFRVTATGRGAYFGDITRNITLEPPNTN